MADLGSGISLLLPLIGTTQAALKKVDKGTGPLSFTRATTATRLNPDTNLIEAVASGDLREDGRQYLNRLLYSEDFSKANWVPYTEGSVSGLVPSPDGKMNAYKFSASAVNLRQGIYQGVGGITYGSNIILSYHLKKGNVRYIVLGSGAGPTWKVCTFDFDSGAVVHTSGATAVSVTPLTGGWFRVSITITTDSAGAWVAAWLTTTSTNSAPPSYSGSGDYFYLYGFQVHDGTTAKRYVKSGSSPAYAPKGVLIEGQRTNLLTYSEQFDNAAWSNIGGGSVSANVIASPDGSTTADGMVEAAATTYFGRFQAFSATSGEKYAYSCYVSAGSRSWAYLRDDITGDTVFFDLSTGTVGTTSARFTGAKITYIANGWWRIEAVWTADATATRRFAVGSASADNTPSYLGTAATIATYYWGAQLEQASFPSSYISTSSTAVTRNEDALTLVSSGNIDGTVGSLSVNFEVGMNSAGTLPQYYQSIVGGNNMFMYVQGTAYDVILLFDGATAATQSGSAMSVSNKAVTRWGGSSAGACVNGGAVGIGGFDGNMNVSGSIVFGGGYAGFGPNKLHLKHVIVFNRAILNSEMQTITAAA